MKRVQVFKKTLLSAAVVTALGGNIGWASAAGQSNPYIINIEKLMNVGTSDNDLQEIFKHIEKEAGYSAPDLKRYLMGSVDELKKGGNSLAELRKTELEKQKVVSGLEAKINKEKDEKQKESLTKELEAAQKGLVDAQKALNDKLESFKNTFKSMNRSARKKLFTFKKDSNAASVKPKGPQLRITPLEPVVTEETIVRAANPSFDGTSTGANISFVDADTAQVNKVVAEIGKISDDDLNKQFVDSVVTPAKDNNPETITYSAKTSVTISNLSIGRDEIRTAIANKLESGTKLGKESSDESTITLSDQNGLKFKHSQVVLDNVENNPDGNSVLADITSTATEGTDPAGSYVLTGKGTLYHKNVGKERALDEVVVESQNMRVQESVTARKVVIGKDGSISGYSMVDKTSKDKDNNTVTTQVQKDEYADIVARLPADVMVKDAKDSSKIIGRVASSFESGSSATQHLNVTGFETITFTDGNLMSEKVGFDTAGKPDARSVTIQKGTHIYKDGGLGLAGENVLIGKDATVKSTKTATPDKNKPEETVNRDALTTITAPDDSSRRRAEQKLGDDGKWVNTGKMILPETKATIDGIVLANLHNYDHVVVSGTLTSDQVGSSQKRIKTFSMTGDTATVSKFSNTAKTIYGEKTVAYDFKDGQTMVNDLDGFGSFHLDGGTFRGDLTGTAADDPKADGAFKGSTVTLTSGNFLGGTVKNAQPVIIDGPVVISPKSIALTNIGDDGKQEETGLHAGIFEQKVTVTAKGQPMIFKTLTKTTPGAEKGQPATITYETPVLAQGGMNLEKGAELRVNINLSESEEVRNVAFVKVDKTLTVNDNVVRATIDQTNDYDLTKSLYQQSKNKASKQKDAGVSFKIVDADKIEGSFANAETDARFIKVEGEQLGEDGERHSYNVSAKYNTEAFRDLKSKYNLSDSQVGAIEALEIAALSSENGKSIHERVTGSTDLRRLANETTRNEVLNGGLAKTALSVHNKVNDAISRRLDRSRTGINTGDMFESQGFWGQYFYNDGKMDTKGDVLGFDSKINGFTLGVDADVNSNLTAGLAFSYANSKLSTKDVSGETKTDTYMGSVYSGWHRGSYFVDSMLSYAAGRNDIERGSGANSYKGEGVKSSVWGARVVGGYTFNINPQWTLQPQAEFNYASFKLDEFTEKGNAEIQHVKIKDFAIMELGGGLKAFGEFDAGRGILKPEASLMAYHDFKDGKPEGSYKLVLGEDSTWHSLSGKSREQNRYALGLGASYAMDNNLSLGLNYDYNWSGDFKAHGFMARISYEF